MIRLIAFDMDGTLVDVQSSWARVHEHFGESNRDSVDLFLADQIDDYEFIRRDIRLWWKHNPTITVDDLESILADVPLMPGAKKLFRELGRRELVTAIVSGGIDLLARRIAAELGIAYVLANGFQVDADGRLTGEGLVRVPIKQKEVVLTAVQRQLDIDPEETASVGNSEIDIGLFRRSRIGIAFDPEDDAVRQAATVVLPERNLLGVLDALDNDGGRPRDAAR